VNRAMSEVVGGWWAGLMGLLNGLVNCRVSGGWAEQVKGMTVWVSG
jgi:hypothetical protein